MEIEDLKDIWKKESEAFRRKDEAELAAMLRGKSTSIVGRLKRNVWFELILTSLGGVALLAYALTLPGGSLKWTSMSIPVIFVIYSFYYLKKLRLLNRFQWGSENVKASLENLVISLKGYLRFYKRSYSILYPAYFFLGLLFAAIERGADAFFHQVSRPEIFLTLLVGAIAFFFFSSWLTSWYLKKLYGNHLEKLEALLKELQS